MRANEDSWLPRAMPSTNGLGDLEDVERQLAQVAERRVAGAEVVERESHAQVPQRAQRRLAGLGVLERGSR